MIKSDETTNLVNLWVDSFHAKALVSVQEAAELANVHDNTIRKALEERSLASCRIGTKLIRISLSNLASWLIGSNHESESKWTPGSLPCEIIKDHIPFPIKAGKNLEPLHVRCMRLHPCDVDIQNITIGLVPIITSCVEVTPSELINGFSRIQSHLHTLWIDVVDDQSGASQLPKPISVGDCTPMHGEVAHPRPDLRIADSIFLQPDYRNSKQSNVSGHKFDAGSILFGRQAAAQIRFIGDPMTQEVPKALEEISGYLDITYGIYGF